MDTRYILLISNEAEARRLRAAWILNAGMDVIPLSTLRQGIHTMRVVRPALIICKRALPDGDADDLIQNLRSSGEFADIPVMVMTSENEEEHESDLLKMGAVVVLSDGLGEREYLESIRQTLQAFVQEKNADLQGITGQLARLDILELIRQIAADHGNGLISIDGAVPMELHLLEGQIVHARHGITVGKKALFRCLRIADASYHFFGQRFESQPTVEGDLEELLDEARQSNQRLMANFHRLPQLHQRLKILFSDELKNTHLIAEAQACLEVIRRYPLVKDFLDHFNVPDTVCYEYLITFIERGFIKVLPQSRRVAVLVDSSCDMGASTLETLKIQMIPLKVDVEGEIQIADHPRKLSDLFDIKPRLLARAQVLPTYPHAYLDLCRQRVSEKDCLILFPSTELVPIREQAQKDMDQLRTLGYEGQPLMANELNTTETGSFSLGVGLLAEAAASWALEGQAIETIVENLRRLEQHLTVVVRVHSGRGLLAPRGAAQSLMLCRGGVFRPIARLGRGESTDEPFLNQIRERINPANRLRIALGHVANAWDANHLSEFIVENLPDAVISVHELGPVTARFLGENALLMAFLQS